MALLSNDLRDLFALNVLLQIFDGVVTYQGLALGFAEGNPLVAAAMATFGVGPALALYKAHACGLLFLLRRSVPVPLGFSALRAVAFAYALCSMAPWLGTLGAYFAART